MVAVSWLRFSPRFEFFAGSSGFRLKMKSMSTKQGRTKSFSQHASACGTAFLWSPTEMGLKVSRFLAEIIPMGRTLPIVIAHDKTMQEPAAQPTRLQIPTLPLPNGSGTQFPHLQDAVITVSTAQGCGKG